MSFDSVRTSVSALTGHARRATAIALSASLISLTIPAGIALASRNVTSVTLNGTSMSSSNSITVGSGATISLTINVTNDSGSDWQSTGWRLSGSSGSYTCVNHTDHNGNGSYSETFNVTAPSGTGTYNVYLQAYSNDSCSSGSSGSFTYNNGVVVNLKQITSATVGGSTSTTVAPSASVASVVNLTSTGTGTDNDWGSTFWRISNVSASSGGTTGCYNNSDHTIAGNYSASFNATAPSTPATYNAYFIAYENDNCTGSASPTFTLSNGVTVSNPDTTPPTISGLSNDSTPTKSKTWTWSSDDGSATYRYVIDQNPSGTAGSGAYGATVTATQGSGDGTYYIHVQAKDTTGNESAVTTVSAVLDNTAPIITINNPTTSSAQSKTLTASTNEGTLTMSENAGATCNGTLTFSTYSSLVFSSESDNGKKVCYRAADTAGNTAYSLSDAIAGIDTTSPSVSSIDVVGGNPTNDNPFTVTVQFSESVSGFNPLDSGDVEITNGTVTGTPSGSADTYTFEITPDTSSSGNVTVTVYVKNAAAQDAAGNTSTSQSEFITYDPEAPDVGITGGPSGLTNDNTPTFTFDGESGATFECKLSTDADFSTCDSSTSMSFGTSTPLTDGDYTFIVRATDAAGNSASDDVDFTVDTTPPTFDSGSYANIVKTATQVGTGAGAVIVDYTLPTATDPHGDVTVSCTPDTGSLFQVGTPTTVTCTAEDALGNETSGVGNATFTVTVNDLASDSGSETGIDTVNETALPNNTFENGWKWVFHFTLPFSETNFSMKFSDFVDGANVIGAADNIRFFSSQASTNADEANAITITAADTYSSTIVLDGDADESADGRQIDVTVEMKIPEGSQPGNYSADYSAQAVTWAPPSIPIPV